MKSKDDCEKQLQQLGQDWPRDPSFADKVFEKIEARTVPQDLKDELIVNLEQATNFEQTQPTNATPVSKTKGMTMFKLSLAGGMAAAVAIALFLFPPFNNGNDIVSAKMLPTEMKNAWLQQDSVHIRSRSIDPATGKKGSSEFLYVRGKGSYSQYDGGTEVDNGIYHWIWNRGSKKVRRARSITANFEFYFSEIANKFDFSDGEYERLRNEDKVVAGKTLNCYELKNLAPFAEWPQRRYVYVDDENRIRMNVSWVFKNGQWDLAAETIASYNDAIDESLFQPKFDETFTVINVDAQVEQFFNLEDAVFKKTANGAVYAVHRAEKLVGGGVSMLVSFRPTAGTKQSETKSGETKQFSMSSTANIFLSTHECLDGFRIPIAAMSHQSIHAVWYVYVPSDGSFPFKRLSNGKFQTDTDFWTIPSEPVNHSLAGARAAQNKMEIEISNIENPITVKEATTRAYRNHQQLSDVSVFSHLRLNDIYFKEDGIHSHSNESPTSEEFTQYIVDQFAYLQGRANQAEAKKIEQQIRYGRMQIYVPGLLVGGLDSFSDEHLRRAAKRKNIEAIMASNTNISDAGLEYLVPLEKLRELSIESNQITDDGLQHLAKIKSLRSLDVRKTSVSKEGVEMLKKSIPGLSIYSDFDSDE